MLILAPLRLCLIRKSSSDGKIYKGHGSRLLGKVEKNAKDPFQHKCEKRNSGYPHAP